MAWTAQPEAGHLRVDAALAYQGFNVVAAKYV